MSYWNEAATYLQEIDDKDGESLTVDQKIELAKVKALVALGQEISMLNPQNLSYKDSDGNKRNGFGLRTHDDPKPDSKFVSFG